MRRTFVVAYDIADPARWRKVYKILLGQGDPLQYSVFVCRLSVVEKKLLEDRLVHLIVPSEDSVLFLDLGQEDRPVSEWYTLLGKSRAGSALREAPRWLIV